MNKIRKIATALLKDIELKLNKEMQLKNIRQSELLAINSMVALTLVNATYSTLKPEVQDEYQSAFIKELITSLEDTKNEQ